MGDGTNWTWKLNRWKFLNGQSVAWVWVFVFEIRRDESKFKYCQTNHGDQVYANETVVFEWQLDRVYRSTCPYVFSTPLVTLALYIKDHSENNKITHFSPLRKIRCPHLRTLCISENKEEMGLDKLMKEIDCPQIDSFFSFTLEHGRDDWGCSWILQLFGNSFICLGTRHLKQI